MDAELANRLRAAAARAFAGRAVLVAYAYGSRVSGRPRPESDLDVGYYPLDPQRPVSIRDEMALAADLSAALGLEVDLRSLADAPLEARGGVLEEGVRIYSGDEGVRVALEQATLSFYHDYKESFRRMHEERLSAQARTDALDRSRLDPILANLRAHILDLERLARIPQPEFLANPDQIGSAKYRFVVAIECCIDIANHIIASEDLRFPRDNADSFVVLAESGIVAETLREPLRAMAKFRNRLVHLYWDIDDARIWGYLQESLDDLRRFDQAIVARFGPS